MGGKNERSVKIKIKQASREHRRIFKDSVYEDDIVVTRSKRDAINNVILKIK